MLTLTQASITARKSIRYSIYFIIFLIIGRMFLNVAIGVYKKVFPPKAPPPTVAFGRLPKLPFPEKQNLNINFVLETPEGELPKISEQAKVYFMPKLSANLLSLDFAKERAESLGYNSDPIEVDDSTYEFKHKTTTSIYKTNIVTNSFSLSYDLVTDPSPLSLNPPVPEIASESVKSFLQNSDSLPKDLTGPETYEFLKLQSSGLINTTSLSDANFVKVHLFRKNYSDIPSVTPSFTSANIWFVVSGVRERGKNIITGQYHYFPIDEEQNSTYPIKTPQKAWEELTSKNYYTATFGLVKEGETVKIRRVYIAYYDSGIQTDFFQPVFVFESTDRKFVAYVPAISSEYYGE